MQSWQILHNNKMFWWGNSVEHVIIIIYTIIKCYDEINPHQQCLEKHCRGTIHNKQQQSQFLTSKNSISDLEHHDVRWKCTGNEWQEGEHGSSHGHGSASELVHQAPDKRTWSM